MSLARQIMDVLPHDLSRTAFRVINPGGFANVNALRVKRPRDPDDNSLMPFIEHRCIFVHIPKCAGLSVSHSLFGCQAGNHLTVSEYRKAFSRSEFASYFKFTFVRNPWDRLVSIYYYLKDGGRGAGDQRWAERLLGPYDSFEAFVMNFITEENIQDAFHLRPQYQFLCQTKRSRPEVDFVGRFERLEQDFALVCAALSIDRPLQSRNRGRSRPAGYRSAYTPPMVDAVATAYARDIELFGYDF